MWKWTQRWKNEVYLSLFYLSLLESTEAFKVKRMMGNREADTNLWGNNEKDAQKTTFLPHPPDEGLWMLKILIDFSPV